jgi:cytochrome oxidase Cu insertion factor (SCO1/SenC/PrrC family)
MKNKYLIVNSFYINAAKALWVMSICVLSMDAHAAEGLFPGTTVLAPPRQPAKLPDFEFVNLNGGTLKSADTKGKVIIIRFWATW